MRKWIKKNIGHPLKTLRDSGEFEEVWEEVKGYSLP